jgi:hypothetical protein
MYTLLARFSAKVIASAEGSASTEQSRQSCRLAAMALVHEQLVIADSESVLSAQFWGKAELMRYPVKEILNLPSASNRRSHKLNRTTIHTKNKTLEQDTTQDPRKR